VCQNATGKPAHLYQSPAFHLLKARDTGRPGRSGRELPQEVSYNDRVVGGLFYGLNHGLLKSIEGFALSHLARLPTGELKTEPS
jgi:hypothetical protein